MAAEAGTSYASGTRPKRHPRRPYETICFEAQRIEKGTDRFNIREDRFPPSIATWRNNLTALSKYHNLYFVACSTQIHVFEPAPPGQTIHNDPSIIINPVMKDPAAPGYISTRNPHAINRILVDDLGRDEILLLATDSGNVTAYRTQHVLKAIQNAKAERQNAEEAGRNPGPRDTEVEVFFSEFVGLSAWGLAIHKYARLIAVGANTSEITVFAFALVDASTSSRDDGEDPLDLGEYLNLQSQEWMTIQTPEDFEELSALMPDRHRSRNLRLILGGHFTNIPNISFLNSDLDLEGNWLVSADIDNRLLVWNIWKQVNQVNQVNEFDFAEPGVGWNVLALDSRNFRQAATRAEACGGRPVEMEDRYLGNLDTSHLVRLVPDVSEAYTYFPPERPDDGYVSEGSFDIGDPVSVTTNEGVVKYLDPPRKGSNPNISSDKSMNNDSSQGSVKNEQEYVTTERTAEAQGSQGHATGELESEPGNSSPSDTNSNEMELEDESHAADPSGSAPQPAQGSSGPAGNQLVPAALGQHPHWQLEEEGVPMNPTHFLQLVMQDAFGGEISGIEDNSEDYEPDEESGEEGSGDQEMAGPPEDGDGEPDRRNEDDDDDDDSMGGNQETDPATFYNIFKALVAQNGIQYSSQDNSDAEGQQQPKNSQQPFLGFPILHFSDTDIRLLTNPFSVRPSLICRDPFKQPFSVPILSIHSCDRINMVENVPELGIVIAATQKGRVAVITLTHVKSECLPYFRVDWIAPFKSQERFGERPLCPLLGIAVGPVPSQLHRYPSDESLNQHVETKLKNDFHSISMDTDDDEQVAETLESEEHDKSKGKGKQSTPSKKDQEKRSIRLDYPTNSHHEPWHENLEYSRRYRLMLYYSDHTIMSYQLYYDWPRRMFPGIPDEYTPEDVFLNL